MVRRISLNDDPETDQAIELLTMGQQGQPAGNLM